MNPIETGSSSRRRPGILTMNREDWLVMTESVENPQTNQWIHNTCGGEIQVKKVHFSVHDSLISLAGSGGVRVHTVPYCPNCENEPSESGVINRDGSFIIRSKL